MTTLNDWLSKVRVSLEDYGNTVTDNFTADGTTKVWKLTNPPIQVNSDVVTDAGATDTRGTDYTINYDNGEITFTVAPTTGHAMVVQYTSVIWRNERIIDAINGGVRALYPSCYKIGQVYIQLRNDVYEYDLTNTTDIPDASSFTDQTVPADYVAANARVDLVKAQTRIHFAEYRPYGANQVFTPYENFRRTTPRNIQIDMDPAPNDTLRLTYSCPFTPFTDYTNLSAISDVPDEFFELPEWYALATLMDKKEARRSRYDGYSVMQNTNAVPVGTQAQTAEDYLARFYDALSRRSMRPLRMSSRRMMRHWQMEARSL